MLQRIDLTRGAGALPSTSPVSKKSGPSEAFASILEQQLQQSAPPVRFSSHAQHRLESRQVSLTPTDKQRLNEAVEQLAQKGSRESLVLMDRMAMVVNVPNRTVITVVPQSDATGNVFTNIDSAVVVPKDGTGL